MKTIRQVYLYAVAFISLEVVVWGLILLLRTSLSRGAVIPDAGTLSGGLALILVGLPIFAIHWLWGQRIAATDEDEQSGLVRALFMYSTLTVTLIPVIQNILALLNRFLLQVTGADTWMALLGQNQTLLDNAIAIVVNTVAAAYFWNVLRLDWKRLATPENFTGVRRIYRYVWLVYSLIFVLWGIQLSISFLTQGQNTTILGFSGLEAAINSITLLTVGTPLWFYNWKICQDALQEPAEQQSNLRLGVLYILSVMSVLVVLGTGGLIFYILLNGFFSILSGASPSLSDFLSNIRGPLSLVIPFGLVWGYYGQWFHQESESRPEAAQRAGIRRLYYYILAPVGLATTIIGISLLISFLLQVLFSNQSIVGTSFREQLAGAIATLAIGVPLWLLMWLPMQAEATQAGELGDLARQSLIRRMYLYLVTFISVITLMGLGGWLLFTLLRALLSSDFPVDFSRQFLDIAQRLLLSVLTLVYHLFALRRDGTHASDTLSLRHKNFPVLVLDREGSGFGARMAAQIQKQAPDLPVAIQSVEQPVPDGAETASAIVLTAEMALNPPEALRLWLREYAGARVVVPGRVQGWHWPTPQPQDAENQAIQTLRQLANGETAHPIAGGGRSFWDVAAYILAGLFLLQICFSVLLISISFLF